MSELIYLFMFCALLGYTLYKDVRTSNQLDKLVETMARLSVSKNVGDYLQSQTKIKPQKEIIEEANLLNDNTIPLEDVNASVVFNAWENQERR